MATYRIGIGSFNLKDGNIGIGTETTGFGNLKVEGTIKTTDLDVGVSTFTRYSGFEGEQTNIIRDQTLSGEYSTTGDIVVDTGNTLTVGLGSTACIGAVECLSIKNHFSVPVGDTAGRNKSSGYAEGTVRYNKDLGTVEFYNGDEWKQFTFSGATGRILIKAAVANKPETHYLQASTLGNSMDFGLAFNGAYGSAGMSNNIRAVYSGGWATPSNNSDIEYYTIASKGNGIDWGANGNGWGMGAISNSTRGIAGGGDYPSPFTNQMEMHLFSTTGSKVDYGDLTAAKAYMGTTGCNSPIKGTFQGGYTPSYLSVIDVKQIASDGNAVEFGNLQKAQGGASGGSNQTRGIIGENKAPGLGMATYITIASDGNAAYFGDLTASKRSGVGATQTRCIFSGGNTANEVMEYVEIASTGNVMSFGDLMTSQFNSTTNTSDSHGGLGGF